MNRHPPGIINAPRAQGQGRVTKATKPPTQQRGRPAPRRLQVGTDLVPNQDPDLDAVQQQLEQDDIAHHEQQHAHAHAQAQAQAHAHAHASNGFDPDGAGIAQAAQDQIDLTGGILPSNANPMGVSPDAHADLAHMDHHGEPGPHTTESFAHQSGYQNVNVESALAKRLAREPGMRLATQRRPEQSLNLNRRSNVEALFAHIAGVTAPVPCKNCHKGHGPWSTCVIVDGQMCGSCANCWFNASGARCSFHETRNPSAHGAPVMPPDGNFNMPPIPPSALGGFNYVSSSASADPVVRYTIERAMTDVRAADKKTRHMFMIEAAARQLAYQVVTFEEAQQEEQQHQHHHHQVHDQGQPQVHDQGLLGDDNGA